MAGKPFFTSRDYPAWMIEGTAQILFLRINEQPGTFNPESMLGAIDLGAPFAGLQSWEEGVGAFYTVGGGYEISASLIVLYTEHVGLSDQAWAVDLWLNIGANNQDWRAAWQQTYGAPIEEFYAWADTTFNTYNTFHS